MSDLTGFLEWFHKRVPLRQVRRWSCGIRAWLFEVFAVLGLSLSTNLLAAQMLRSEGTKIRTILSVIIWAGFGFTTMWCSSYARYIESQYGNYRAQLEPSSTGESEDPKKASTKPLALYEYRLAESVDNYKYTWTVFVSLVLAFVGLTIMMSFFLGV